VTALGSQTAATGYTFCAITCPVDGAAFTTIAVVIPIEDEVVIIKQMLSITGATVDEVCTDTSKKLLMNAFAEVLDVKIEFVSIISCSAKTDRRSRRLLTSDGVDIDFQVEIPATEATSKKQTAVLELMMTLQVDSAATTVVLAAVAEATGKDVSTLAVKGSKPTVPKNVVDPGTSNDKSRLQKTKDDVSNNTVMIAIGCMFGILVCAVLSLLALHFCKKDTKASHSGDIEMAYEITDIELVANPMKKN